MSKAEEGNLINITIRGWDCACPECLKDIIFKDVRVTRLIVQFECAHCGQGCQVETGDFIFFGGKH